MTDEPWPAGDLGGVPFANYGNAYEALLRANIGGCFDTFSDRPFVSGSFLLKCPCLLGNDSVSDIRHHLYQAFGTDFGKANVRDSCEYLSRQSPFNAVLDDISDEEWDGKDRISRLVETYHGVEHQPYYGAVSRRALASAVRLLKQPGCQVDWAWVLQGPQNAGKTTFVRIMAGDWYGEGDLLRKNEQQIQECLKGAWLYELSETGGLDRANERTVKAIISRRDDGTRRAYGHDFEHQPRHTFLFLTTNDPIFLRDQTGNRRFHITPFKKLAREKLVRDRAQIWAQALVLEATGIGLQIPRKYTEAAEAARSQSLEHDPWLDILGSIKGIVVGDEIRVSNAMVLAHLGISKDRQTSANLRRAAECVLHLGWLRGTFKINGSSCRGFVRKRSDARA